MRHLINIIENATDTVSLYRGDATNITTFDLDKTDKSALFGRGIYLTDNPEVARDYTISKGAGDDLVHHGDGYATQKDAIAGYLRTILAKELGWPQKQQEIRDNFSNQMSDDPEYRANLGWQGDRAIFERVKKEWYERSNVAMVAEYKKYLEKAKKIYHSRAHELRIFKDTMGEWTITKAGRSGAISHFDIPRAYLAKTIHGDTPMDEKSFQVVRAFVLKYRPHGMDNRTHDNQTIMDFDKWIEHFKDKGSYYGWRDREDDDYYIGGKGAYPSLGELWGGSFGGMSLFHQHGDDFIPYMMSHGYTGIEYDGGVRAGSAGTIRGLGGVRHQSFVLWDDAYVNQCRTASTGVEDDDIDTAATKGLRAATMLKKQHNDPYYNR